MHNFLRWLNWFEQKKPSPFGRINLRRRNRCFVVTEYRKSASIMCALRVGLLCETVSPRANAPRVVVTVFRCFMIPSLRLLPKKAGWIGIDVFPSLLALSGAASCRRYCICRWCCRLLLFIRSCDIVVFVSRWIHLLAYLNVDRRGNFLLLGKRWCCGACSACSEHWFYCL